MYKNALTSLVSLAVLAGLLPVLVLAITWYTLLYFVTLGIRALERYWI